MSYYRTIHRWRVVRGPTRVTCNQALLLRWSEGVSEWGREMEGGRGRGESRGTSLLCRKPKLTMFKFVLTKINTLMWKETIGGCHPPYLKMQQRKISLWGTNVVCVMFGVSLFIHVRNAFSRLALSFCPTPSHRFSNFGISQSILIGSTKSGLFRGLPLYTHHSLTAGGGSTGRTSCFVSKAFLSYRTPYAYCLTGRKMSAQGRRSVQHSSSSVVQMEISPFVRTCKTSGDIKPDSCLPFVTWRTLCEMVDTTPFRISSSATKGDTYTLFPTHSKLIRSFCKIAYCHTNSQSCLLRPLNLLFQAVYTPDFYARIQSRHYTTR